MCIGIERPDLPLILILILCRTFKTREAVIFHHRHEISVCKLKFAFRVRARSVVPWYKFPWFLKLLLRGEFNARAAVKRR